VTIIDMHPDDLLDRELAGTLSPGERRRLAEHLAQCPSCRLERQLRDDFSHELVTSRAPDVLQTFVSGALRAALPANGATPPLGMQTPVVPAPVVPARRVQRRRAAFLAMAFVIAGGAAAAQTGLVEQIAGFAREQLTKAAGEPAAKTAVVASARASEGSASKSIASEPVEPAEPDSDVAVAPRAHEPEPPAPSLEESDRAPALEESDRAPGRASERKKARATKSKKARASERQRRSSRAAVAPVAVSDEQREDTALVESSSLDLTPRDAVEAAPRTAARLRARSSGRARSEASPVVALEPTLRSTSDDTTSVRGEARRIPDNEPSVVTATSLFHHANSARREGLSSEALHSYERLRAEFPTSAEARLSLVLAARMHLDSGRLGDAIAGFDAYIATRDRSLREQALAGRAIALGRLGRTREELAAWQSLLLDYPDSSYATVASQRLRQDQR
jgi:hypothetical protein